MQNANPAKQSGMALVVALLVVALVTTIAVELSWRFDLSISRSGNRWHGMQARAYLEGAEILAKMALKQDMEETPGIDTLAEMWARESGEFPTDEGYVAGKLEDAQGRFNLNLLDGKAPPPKQQGRSQEDWERFTPAQRHFMRLLQTIELQEGFVDMPAAMAIVESIIDWMDADREPTGFNGAEGDYYAQMEPPYTIANRPMVSVTELLIIKGMTPELYQALLPLVIALPKEPEAKININTMPVKLIQSLGNNQDLTPILSEEDALSVLEERAFEGYDNIDDFVGSPVLSQILGEPGDNLPAQTSTSYFDVKSNYFLFFGEAMVGDHIRYSNVIMQRTEQEIFTLRRTDANF